MSSAADFQTPMMRQYAQLKREHPDALLLFRCGDFYETYATDAEEAGRLLNIVVTRKGAGADGEVAMAGIPHHALNGYLARIVAAGRCVAIAEQMEDPKTAKGLVKREIARVVTPGTVLDEGMLDEAANNYLVAMAESPDGRWGVATADLSTGFFGLTELDGEQARTLLADELVRLEAREIIVPEEMAVDWLVPALDRRAITWTRRAASDFATPRARALLLDHFKVQSLEAFGAEEFAVGIGAAGALLRYLRETQRSLVGHIAQLRVHSQRRGLVLDAVTQRSLELVRNLHGGGKDATLLSVLDRTTTPMGARCLRGWLLEPLRDKAAIEARLDAVEELTLSGDARTRLAERLRGVRDIERIVSRASLGSASPRDLASLRFALQRLPELQAGLGNAQAARWRQLAADIEPLPHLRDALDRGLVDEPPQSVADGHVIRDGYNDELDRLRNLSRDSKEWIAEFRAREAQRTGIDKLKIGYNNVFGYFIELSHAQIRTLPGGEPPAGWVRKQTLSNAERYITPELKQKEDEILHAEERRAALETALFDELRRAVAAEAAALQRTAERLAEIDCLRALADVAVARSYVRPRFTDDGRHEIVDGRHPVLEALQPDPPFVANDCFLSPRDCQVALITGPNMAGKSTFIRQVALVTLMAQMGSFVPAREARLHLVDRIFTRVGAMDHLARGQSTFLVEMTETANILRHATDDSLVILDEIGRGTSTYDGLSIAWAVCEHLHNTPGQRARTLFATHYHELTALEGPLARLRNFHVAVLEQTERIVFLYKVVAGSTDRSYGVHAAQFAGVPPEVVARARDILAALERGDAVAPVAANEDASGMSTRVKGRKKAGVLPQAEPWRDKQLSLFEMEQPPHEALKRLRALDPNRLTPLEALALLAELRRLADT